MVGQGTFSDVVFVRQGHKQWIVKIIRAVRAYRKDAQTEDRLLQKIVDKDPHDSAYEWFLVFPFFIFHFSFWAVSVCDGLIHFLSHGKDCDISASSFTTLANHSSISFIECGKAGVEYQEASIMSWLVNSWVNFLSHSIVSLLLFLFIYLFIFQQFVTKFCVLLTATSRYCILYCFILLLFFISCLMGRMRM